MAEAVIPISQLFCPQFPFKFLFFRHSDPDRVAVRFKPFHIGDLHHGFADLVQPFFGIEDQARLLHEAVRGQGREETSGAAGGQHVVWSGNIISNGLGRVMAEENGAGVLDQRQKVKGFFHRKLEMFRGNGV